MSVEIDERITAGYKRFWIKNPKPTNVLEKENNGNGHTTSNDYGAETWPLANRQKSKLAVAQRSMERAML